MTSIQQIQTMVYGFVSSLLLCMIYAFVNRLFYRLQHTIRRLSIQLIIMIGLGYLFYVGLVFINGGVLRFYIGIAFILGYLFYQLYYASGWLVFLEYIIKIIKKICFPIYFISKKIYRLKKSLMKIRENQKCHNKSVEKRQNIS